MARLMTGDIAGATEIHERYAQSLAGNPMRPMEIERAEWDWATGRRRQHTSGLLAIAGAAGSGPAARIGGSLVCRTGGYGACFWATARRRADGAGGRERSRARRLPATALIAKFLTQPPATPEEWRARAGKLFPPNPALEPLRDVAVAAALLVDREYQPASEILRKLYDEGARTPIDEGLPVLLAWTLLETGRYQEAAGLLRFNPVPPPRASPRMPHFTFPVSTTCGGSQPKRAAAAGSERGVPLVPAALPPRSARLGEEAKAK